MNQFDPNIHHRRSVRLRNYDYSQRGLYFITICVQDMRCLFGNVVDGIMSLNGDGRVIEERWNEIPSHYPDVYLHAFTVMPNHLHGIIGISVECGKIVGAQDFVPLQPTPPRRAQDFVPLQAQRTNGVGAQNFVPSQPGQNPPAPQLRHLQQKPESQYQRNEFQRITPRSVGAIVRGFKIGVTKKIGRSVFQSNYHEHIIRDEDGYRRITEYIVNNPATWDKDRFYSGRAQDFAPIRTPSQNAGTQKFVSGQATRNK